MQMKKNYLLLFFIALLFGIGTLPGRALEFSKIDPTVGYVMKIGSGYLFIQEVKNDKGVVTEIIRKYFSAFWILEG